MDFQKLIRERYSVRAYKPDPVDDEKLARVLEAGLAGGDAQSARRRERERRRDNHPHC